MPDLAVCGVGGVAGDRNWEAAGGGTVGAGLGGVSPPEFKGEDAGDAAGFNGAAGFKRLLSEKPLLPGFAAAVWPAGR